MGLDGAWAQLPPRTTSERRPALYRDPLGMSYFSSKTGVKWLLGMSFGVVSKDFGSVRSFEFGAASGPHKSDIWGVGLLMRGLLCALATKARRP